MTIRLEALPPADAIAALEARGRRLDPSFAWQDVFQDEHAQAYTAAKSAGFDILGDLFEATISGLRDGTGQREFDARLIPILQEKGWWGRQFVTDPATGEQVVAQLGSLRRLKTIFDVNMRVSYAAGHWASFERNKAARPMLRYVAILDDRTRPEHRARHNLCLPVDHPYWDTWAPPCGWSCRCTLQSLSLRDVERMRPQLRFEPPALDARPWTNKRTGEITWVPEGIDPGWAYNPGKAGYRASIEGAQKLIDAPPALAAGAAEDPDWIRRPLGAEFAGWVDAAGAGGAADRPRMVIGALDRPVLDALDERGIAPESGAITLDRDIARRAKADADAGRPRAVSPEMLRRLPDLMTTARLAVLRDRRDGGLLYVLDHPEDAARRIVVRLDFSRRGAGADPSAPIPTNAIRSAAIVEAGELRADVYELLTGAI